jgi:hypothetical protein
MLRSLPGHLSDLIREIITKYHPEMYAMLDSTKEESFSAEQAGSLQESAGSEFCKSGLKEGDEPNDRGLLLEELIDWLAKDQ